MENVCCMALGISAQLYIIVLFCYPFYLTTCVLQALDPSQPFIDEQMVYTDNAAYLTVSHGSNTKPAETTATVSGVKILTDNKNDGKEVVILPEKR